MCGSETLHFPPYEFLEFWDSGVPEFRSCTFLGRWSSVESGVLEYSCDRIVAFWGAGISYFASPPESGAGWLFKWGGVVFPLQTSFAPGRFFGLLYELLSIPR